MTLGNFSQQADAYQRARPSYPNQLIDELVEIANVKPGDPVADFGAGTGILTNQLLARGLAVTAIEPNADMRSKADTSRAVWLSGSFESCSLPDSSQAWAIAAQAFHWANPPQAIPEVHRVLRPNAWFTILWNNRVPQANAIVSWTEKLTKKLVPEFDEAYRKKDWGPVLTATGLFSSVRTQVVRHSIEMNRSRYLELWKSHNRLQTFAGKERFQDFMDQLVHHLDQNQVESVDVTYDCEAWSVKRVEV